MMETGEETEHNVEHELTKILQGLDKRLCATEVQGAGLAKQCMTWQPSLPLLTGPHSAHLGRAYKLLFSKYKFNISDPNWNKTMTDNGKTPNAQFKTDIEAAVKMYDLVTNILKGVNR